MEIKNQMEMLTIKDTEDRKNIFNWLSSRLKDIEENKNYLEVRQEKLN